MANAVASESDAYRQLGGQLADVLVLGTAAGAGGMGLWHLLKNLKSKQEKAKEQQKDFYSIANTPPPFLSQPQGALKVSFDAKTVGTALLPVGGAGLGALIGAVRARKGKKLTGALTGAGIGGGLGAAGGALATDAVREQMGKAIPDLSNILGVFSSSSNLGPKGGFKDFYQRAMYNLALPVAGGVGVYGGAKAVNSLLQNDNEEENKDKVQRSRDDYFKTLLNTEEEKTAFSEELDRIYEKYASDSWRNWFKETFWHDPNRGPWSQGTVGDSGQFLMSIPPWLMGASALAGATGGAAYMYDKTKQRSQARRYSLAQKARERLRGLDAPFVDPVELAQIKQLTAQNGSSNNAGG